jgi:hypothetical protein
MRSHHAENHDATPGESERTRHAALDGDHGRQSVPFHTADRRCPEASGDIWGCMMNKIRDEHDHVRISDPHILFGLFITLVIALGLIIVIRYVFL